MMNSKIEKLVNDQMNFEIESVYIYMSMAAYFDSLDLYGFSNWMKVQVQEEVFHATKMYNHLVDRNARPAFSGVPVPQKEWTSPLAAFEHALKHECIVTSRINAIAHAANEDKDFATRNFVEWFISEQVEEEANVDKVIKQLKLMKDSNDGLFLIDKDLAARVYTPPVTTPA